MVAKVQTILCPACPQIAAKVKIISCPACPQIAAKVQTISRPACPQIAVKVQTISLYFKVFCASIQNFKKLINEYFDLARSCYERYVHYIKIYSHRVNKELGLTLYLLHNITFSVICSGTPMVKIPLQFNKRTEDIGLTLIF